MQKNDIYEMTIEDIGNDGEGIGHIADRQSGKKFAVFVKDTVVGDVIKVKLIKIKKSYAYGRLVEIIKSSPYRIEPVCEKARSCGGCTLMHMDYQSQLDYKKNKVKGCLQRIGGIDCVEELMEPCHGMENPYNYRNKMQFPVAVDKNGRVKIGFYAGHTHDVIDLNECAIGHEVNKYIVEELRKWLQKWHDKAPDFIYNEEKHNGLVRHILTRVGFTTGEVMVCIVINGNGFDEECQKELSISVNKAVSDYNEEVMIVGIKECKNDKSVDGTNNKYENDKSATGTNNKCENDKSATEKNKILSLKYLGYNINKDKTNRILGDKCVTLEGKDYITDYIGDVKFNISPLSFYQVNPYQTEKLYSKALEYASLSGGEIVWDLYCGIGTISLFLAKKAKEVYGVEIVPQAIEDAKVNAKINNIDNAHFYCEDAGVFADRIKGTIGTDNSIPKPDVILVDPPRKGLDGRLIDVIIEADPERIVYVSCDPATLARDVKILDEKGYKVNKVAVYDQFGFSTHVETVVLMSKVK